MEKKMKENLKEIKEYCENQQYSCIECYLRDWCYGNNIEMPAQWDLFEEEDGE